VAHWGLIGVEPGITVGVAVCVFAVLTLKQSLKVVIPPADVAGLFQRILIFFVEIGLLNRCDSLPVTDASEGGSTVGASVGELAAL
jgi:hypothetical protein